MVSEHGCFGIARRAAGELKVADIVCRHLCFLLIKPVGILFASLQDHAIICSVALTVAPENDHFWCMVLGGQLCQKWFVVRPPNLFGGEEELACRKFDPVHGLRWRICIVQNHKNGANSHHSEEDRGILFTIAGHDRHPVSMLNSLGQQCSCDEAGLPAQVIVGPASACPWDADTVGLPIVLALDFEEFAEGEVDERGVDGSMKDGGTLPFISRLLNNGTWNLRCHRWT